ncbi:LuxR C-terminal-related transcriptional regulator [Streptomyces sp. NPDC058751]|uniref:LuxR C-terminal-related transcriptional regulator n=1 Tax=Streptomyces sp. NPDC058751 TaxID=3346623 RepID=UPI0036BEF5B5
MSEDGGRVGRARRAAVRAATAARSVEEFFDVVMTALAPLLPFDIWAGVTVDPATLMNTGGNYRNAVPESLMPRMLDIEYREGDVNLLPDLARRPSPVGLLSREAGDLLAHSPRYQDIVRPLGYRDELRVALRDRHGVWGALVLGRERDAPAFDDTDLATAATLAQPLGDALRRLQVTRQAWRPPSPSAPGLLLLDVGYQVLHRSPTAGLWLDELLGGDRAPLGERRTGLPPALCAVAAAVRAPAAAGGSFTSWAHTRTLGPARLHAWSLSEGHGRSRAADRDGSTEREGAADRERAVVAVAIESARPEERASFLVTAYGLTPRERTVTELVLRGHSTAEISRLTRVSPHTVQDHLKAVFDKTGVRSRRDLVATLFARHYRPALGQDTDASAAGPGA